MKADMSPAGIIEFVFWERETDKRKHSSDEDTFQIG